MMVKQCRWMKQKVCTSSEKERIRNYRKSWNKSKKDPIQQLLGPLVNMMKNFLGPLDKLLNGSEEKCKLLPKQWCEELPKEWCEPTTKQQCKEVEEHLSCFSIYFL